MFYVTGDAMSDSWNGSFEELSDSDIKAEVIAWRDLYFTWINWYPVAEPETPSADGVAAILSSIGVTPGAALTVTLLWEAAVDLDLYFSCADGSLIYYANMGSPNAACGGTLDYDMQANATPIDIGDGVMRRVENISLGWGEEGHTYNGYIHYYSGSGNAGFQVIFSATVNGELVVYGSQTVNVDTFDT